MTWFISIQMDNNSKRNRTQTHIDPSELGIEGSLGMLQSAIGLPIGACSKSVQLMWAVLSYPLIRRVWSTGRGSSPTSQPLGQWVGFGPGGQPIGQQLNFCEHFINIRNYWAAMNSTKDLAGTWSF